MEDNKKKHIYCFSHTNGKLRTDEIKELLRERWKVLIRYHITKDKIRLIKDIKKLNIFVEQCERKHYHGALFGELKTRNFVDEYYYYNYTFYIRCIDRKMTITLKAPSIRSSVFLITEYLNDNVRNRDNFTCFYKLIPRFIEDSEEREKVINAMLHLYNKKRPSNPFIAFYLVWDQNDSKITTRYPHITKNIIDGFCDCYKSFKPDDFRTDFIFQEQNTIYNKKNYVKTRVTANYLSLLTGINYYIIKGWTDTLFMGDISFRNFVKISCVLNGTGTDYDQYLSPRIFTKFNQKYSSCNLEEIRNLLNTPQEIFAAILGISRKHYILVEKNPDLLGDQSVQSIYNLAKFCDCSVIQLFPMHLIKSYQDQAKDIALKFLLSNPPQKNSTLRKRIIIDIHTTST
jgi:DNA-binding XRE family transcriptional regulator